MCRFCTASWKPMLTNTNHTPLPTTRKTTKKATNWKWMEKAKHMRLHIHNRTVQKRSSKKKHYIQYYFMHKCFFSLSLRYDCWSCFDIQRAVMLALYCCRGNYDELFYIGWYLCVLCIFTDVLFRPLYIYISPSPPLSRVFHSFYFLLLLLLYNFL